MRKQILFFILKFLFVFLILSWFFGLQPVNNFFIGLFMLITKGLLFFFGSGTSSIVGNQIIVNGNPLIMIKECTGTSMYSLFFAFAIAYGSFKYKKLKGIGIGLLILFGLNILRLLTILIVAYFSKAMLDFMHNFLWPSTFFIFTLIVAAYYVKRYSK